MSEKVIVRQNDRFEIEFRAVDPHDEASEDFQPVRHLHELTPYGMLLTSLGSCTAIVLHTYAQNHDLSLPWVEIELEYERVFTEDCEECESDQEYTERIKKTLTFPEELGPKLRDRYFKISHYCSVNQLLEEGIEIEAHLAEQA
jgi:putative redox protein